MNWELVLTHLFPEFLIAADAASRGLPSFSHISAVPVLAGVKCLDVFYLHKSALAR
jgi:predicted TIM-barrel enzyme